MDQSLAIHESQWFARKNIDCSGLSKRGQYGTQPRRLEMPVRESSESEKAPRAYCQEAAENDNTPCRPPKQSVSGIYSHLVLVTGATHQLEFLRFLGEL